MRAAAKREAKPSREADEKFESATQALSLVASDYFAEDDTHERMAAAKANDKISSTFLYKLRETYLVHKDLPHFYDTILIVTPSRLHPDRESSSTLFSIRRFLIQVPSL